MRRIDVAQRRARLAVRHRLAGKAATAREVADSVVALHSTDPASVFLAVRARTSTVDPQAMERELYEQRVLVRMLGMRRTMFVVPSGLVPVIQAACTDDIAVTQWRTYVKLLSAAGVGDEAWLRDVARATEAALLARGEATGAQLSTDEPRLRTQVQVAEGKAYAAKVNITTWVLLLLAAEGRIVRGRPLGSWISSQYRWYPAKAWLGDDQATDDQAASDQAAGDRAQWTPELARRELARRYLEAFGPATIGDLRWWTGWTATQTRNALASVDVVEVDLDGHAGLVLAADLEPPPEPEPWVALLPALDPTAMGWTARSWYLGAHTSMLFDRSGNVGPTVWSDGRIVGGWGQRSDGEIVYRLLEDVGSEVRNAVDAEAARLGAWIGPVRVTPRFRTPLERELSTSHV